MENNSNVNNDNSSIRLESINDILTIIPHWIIRTGNYCIFGIFLISLFLAWQIKYENIDDYQASILFSQSIQKFFSPKNGKVHSILKQSNSNIKLNEAILVISDNYNSHLLDTIQANKNGKLILLDDIVNNKIILKNELVGIIQSKFSSNSIRISIELEPRKANEILINQNVDFIFKGQYNDYNYKGIITKKSNFKNQNGSIIIDLEIKDSKFYSDLEKNIISNIPIVGTIRVKSAKKSLLDRFIFTDKTKNISP